MKAFITFFCLLMVSVAFAQNIKKMAKNFQTHQQPFFYYQLSKQNPDSYQPQAGDMLHFHYRLLKAGKKEKELQSSYPTGTLLAEMPQNAQKSHFTAALKMLNAGDSLTVLIPASQIKDELNQFGDEFKGKNTVVKICYKLTAIDKKSEVEAKRKMAAEYADSVRFLALGEVLYYQKNQQFSRPAVVAERGLQTLIYTEGQGETLQNAAKIGVHYICFLPNGQIVDSSYPREEIFYFYLNKQQVIEGWEMAIKSLKLGTKALIKIPSALAYGEKGAGNQIPPNTELFFWVEIIE